MDSAELDEDDLDEDDDLTTPIPSYHKLEGALPPSIANSAPTPPSASVSVKKKPFLQTSGKVLPRAVPGGASPAVASSRNMLKSFLPGTRLLSKAKRTLTGKGGGASRGGSGFSFDDGGIGLSSAAQNLVAGRKERQQRKQAQSEIRKNAVKNALYACIEDDDDVVSVGFSTDYYGQKKKENNHHHHNNNLDSTASSSASLKRVQSLHSRISTTKQKKSSNSATSSGNSSRPRRIQSLPMGARRYQP